MPRAADDLEINMIRQVFDMEQVNLVLTHPDIWMDIAPQHIEPFDTRYLPCVTYFMVNDDDGVILFHPFRDGTKIHPNILPAKRGKLAYEAVEESIQSMFEWGYSSIYAEIDPKLRHVTLFARRLGFRLLESGTRDLYIRRNLDS